MLTTLCISYSASPKDLIGLAAHHHVQAVRQSFLDKSSCQHRFIALG